MEILRVRVVKLRALSLYGRIFLLEYTEKQSQKNRFCCSYF